MTFTYDIPGLSEAATAVLSNLTGKTVLIYGDMGSGKTTLVKEIVKQLGYTELVNSPTFSLVNEYKTDDKIIYHFDFYRIEKEEEALDIGVEEYLYSDNWNFIEWPEKISGLLPKNKNEIYLTINKNGTRTLKLKTSE